MPGAGDALEHPWQLSLGGVGQHELVLQEARGAVDPVPPAHKSSGWKNAAMDWISPSRYRGALRNQSSLKARMVGRETR